MGDDFEPYIPPINDGDIQLEIVKDWSDVYASSEEEAHDLLMDTIIDYVKIGSGKDIVAIVDGILNELYSDRERFKLLDWISETSKIQPIKDDEYSNLLLQWNLLRRHTSWDKVDPVSWIRKKLFQLKGIVKSEQQTSIEERNEMFISEMSFKPIILDPTISKETFLKFLEPLQECLSDEDFHSYLENSFALFSTGTPSLLNLKLTSQVGTYKGAWYNIFKKLDEYAMPRIRMEIAKSLFYAFLSIRNGKGDTLDRYLRTVLSNFKWYPSKKDRK